MTPDQKELLTEAINEWTDRKSRLIDRDEFYKLAKSVLGKTWQIERENAALFPYYRDTFMEDGKEGTDFFIGPRRRVNPAVPREQNGMAGGGRDTDAPGSGGGGIGGQRAASGDVTIGGSGSDDDVPADFLRPASELLF